MQVSLSPSRPTLTHDSRAGHFKGSIFVTREARVFLAGRFHLPGTAWASYFWLLSIDLLRGSRFAEDVDYMTNCFDKSTKLRFRNSDDPQYIKFGTVRDKDPAFNIRSGQLRLQG